MLFFLIPPNAPLKQLHNSERHNQISIVCFQRPLVFWDLRNNFTCCHRINKVLLLRNVCDHKWRFCPCWHHTGHERLPLSDKKPLVLPFCKSCCDYILLESGLINGDVKINTLLSNVKSVLFSSDVCNSPQRDCCSNSHGTRRSRLAAFKHVGRLFSQRRGSERLKVSVRQNACRSSL